MRITKRIKRAKDTNNIFNLHYRIDREFEIEVRAKDRKNALKIGNKELLKMLERKLNEYTRHI